VAGTGSPGWFLGAGQVRGTGAAHMPARQGGEQPAPGAVHHCWLVAATSKVLAPTERAGSAQKQAVTRACQPAAK